MSGLEYSATCILKRSLPNLRNMECLANPYKSRESNPLSRYRNLIQTAILYSADEEISTLLVGMLHVARHVQKIL